MHSLKRAKIATLRQFSWCLALALSLLLSQFLGLQHRIDHTRWLTDFSQQQAKEATSSGYVDATHSCIALDAVSLADGVATSLIHFAPSLTQAVHLVLLHAYQWDEPFAAYFHSRAPPAPL